MGKSYDNTINKAYQTEQMKISANAAADRLEALMSLTLTATSNEFELKLILIAFAAFAVYMLS